MLQRITSASALARTFAWIGVTVLLTGCGSLKLPSLSTGSLGTTPKNTAVAAAPAVQPDDPVQRAIQVGVTMARAKKCGYFFNPDQLKASYLAAEAVRYPAPDVQKKVQTALDFGRIRIGRQIAKLDGYCTKDRTEKIKGKLTRYLAGDYTAEAVKQKKSAGLLDGIDTPVDEKPFNPEEIFDPALIE